MCSLRETTKPVSPLAAMVRVWPKVNLRGEGVCTWRFVEFEAEVYMCRTMLVNTCRNIAGYLWQTA